MHAYDEDGGNAAAQPFSPRIVMPPPPAATTAHRPAAPHTIVHAARANNVSLPVVRPRGQPPASGPRLAVHEAREGPASVSAVLLLREALPVAMAIAAGVATARPLGADPCMVGGGVPAITAALQPSAVSQTNRDAVIARGVHRVAPKAGAGHSMANSMHGVAGAAAAA